MSFNAKKIPIDTFEQLQLDAGLIMNTFDPKTAAIDLANIITATTGGVNVVCQPTISDFGEDVDNVPARMKELQHLDYWDCKISTTALSLKPSVIRLSLGAADIDADSGAIVPRAELKDTDFANVWWVGMKAGGGFAAVKLINALSTGGFNLQTTKNGKGQLSLELTGHVSINDQETMPMEFYSIDKEPSNSSSGSGTGTE